MINKSLVTSNIISNKVRSADSCSTGGNSNDKAIWMDINKTIFRHVTKDFRLFDCLAIVIRGLHFFFIKEIRKATADIKVTNTMNVSLDDKEK